jgi:hypothetical protein
MATVDWDHARRRGLPLDASAVTPGHLQLAGRLVTASQQVRSASLDTKSPPIGEADPATEPYPAGRPQDARLW